jgi:hypothetical protein
VIERPDIELVLLRKPDWERLKEHKILFLDFDGVLHPESGVPEMHFCFVPNFCEALEAAAHDVDLHIVISSMWRTYRTLEDLMQHFPEGLRHRIVGVTPDLHIAFEFPNGSRQEEIEAWMTEYAPNGQWLAVDDRAKLFKDDCPNLFLVPEYRPDCGAGLNSVVAAEFTKRLAAFVEQSSLET